MYLIMEKNATRATQILLVRDKNIKEEIRSAYFPQLLTGWLEP
jgi:hypothetical protein